MVIQVVFATFLIFVCCYASTNCMADCMLYIYFITVKENYFKSV